MRTILEHAEEFTHTMDQHSRNHCIETLTKDRAELQDLIDQLSADPVSDLDQELIDSFTPDRDHLTDVIDALKEASS